MEIKIFTENGRVPVTVLHVDGDIDASTYDGFKAKADEVIQNGAKYILVDLSHVSFVSSAGLRALHAIFTELRSRYPELNVSDEEMKKALAAGTYKSPQLKLLNLSKETRTAFELSGFDMFLESFTDMPTAVASF
jgi:anti-anti-sigma factor